MILIAVSGTIIASTNTSSTCVAASTGHSGYSDVDTYNGKFGVGLLLTTSKVFGSILVSFTHGSNVPVRKVAKSQLPNNNWCIFSLCDDGILILYKYDITLPRLKNSYEAIANPASEDDVNV